MGSGLLYTDNMLIFQPGALVSRIDHKFTIQCTNPADILLNLSDPEGNDSFTYNAATQTLTNKTLASRALSSTFSGSCMFSGSL